jgi:hypothetical protein
MKYEIIDKHGKKSHIYTEKTLSAAKHYVDIHGKCFIWDKVSQKIIYPEQEKDNET